jgi:hypothetical protein
MRDADPVAVMPKECRNGKDCVGLEVRRAVTVETTVFWAVIPCSSEKA